MRLFTYYALHTFVNQIRKLFKTWVLALIAICVVVGIVIGLGASAIESVVESHEENIEVVEENVEDEEDSDEGMHIRALIETVMPMEDVVEIGVAATILLILVFSLLHADKSVGNIFQPADTVLLFPSPMRPQSVLMFRLAVSLAMYFFVLIYFLIQIPNLMTIFELTVWSSFSLLLMFILTVVFGMLLQVLIYLGASVSERVKKLVQPVCYGILTLVVVSFFLYYKMSGYSLAESALICLNGKYSRWIPLVGWLKGVFMYSMEDNLTGWCVSLGLLVVLGAILLVIIRYIEADYYEDVLTRVQERAELIEKSKNMKMVGIVRKRKVRTKLGPREEIGKGAGANVFFYKSLYNRFRFAHLGFFTKTTETYLLLGIGMALLSRFIFETTNLLPLMAVLGVVVFWRSLGNPLEQDTKMDYFVMIPESIWAKMFWSLLAGTVNCALDLILLLFIGVLVMGVNPFTALLWMPLLLSVDFFATTVGVFIAVSLPPAISEQIKVTIQILFVYFGILPDGLILTLGIAFGHPLLGELLTLIINLLASGLFYALAGLCLQPYGDRMAG